MNKTLRNKALRGINRLIISTINGEDWATPDGYFATAYPIYDGYRVKKHQSEWTGPKPDLGKVLAHNSLYTQAGAIERIKPDDDIEHIQITTEGKTLKVNAVYWDLLLNIYPDAVAYIADRYAPVELKQDDTLVAVIMPLKK